MLLGGLLGVAVLFPNAPQKGSRFKSWLGWLPNVVALCPQSVRKRSQSVRKAFAKRSQAFASGVTRAVKFPLSLTDSERRVERRDERHGGARPVEFPLSLTDSEHCGTPRATPRRPASCGVSP